VRPRNPEVEWGAVTIALGGSMPRRAIGHRDVRATLDQLGVILLDDTEYAEVALRLAIILEGVAPLMATWPLPDDIQIPADLPRPRKRRR
jgi:hypothetical protein